MPKRIPIARLKEFAKANGLHLSILFAWDGERSHIVTYGTTLQDCDKAAEFGNAIAKQLGWPANLCDATPSRVKKLQNEIARLTQRVNTLEFEKKCLEERTES